MSVTVTYIQRSNRRVIAWLVGALFCILFVNVYNFISDESHEVVGFLMFCCTVAITFGVHNHRRMTNAFIRYINIIEAPQNSSE